MLITTPGAQAEMAEFRHFFRQMLKVPLPLSFEHLNHADAQVLNVVGNVRACACARERSFLEGKT
jgi:hypothetical protein